MMLVVKPFLESLELSLSHQMDVLSESVFIRTKSYGRERNKAANGDPVRRNSHTDLKRKKNNEMSV